MIKEKLMKMKIVQTDDQMCKYLSIKWALARALQNSIGYLEEEVKIQLTGPSPMDLEIEMIKDGLAAKKEALTTILERAAVAEWYRYRTVACFVTSSSPVPLKTRRVGQRCTLNLSRAETFSRWCGVVVRRGVPAQVSSTSLEHGSKITWSVAKSPRVAEQCDVNIQSINQFIKKDEHYIIQHPSLIKVLIKGLPASTDVADIESELKAKVLAVEKIA
ncbi:uncharacterized protein TNCV_2797241 [Trichonephila clavipes]|nr:uncharacterized protein TNCV_2797241 [Trichonephila clavipes]